MRKKDFEKLGRQLIVDLPDYQVDGSLIYAEPIGHILRGIAFDNSSYSKANFYIYVFYQPLCVPHEQRHFTFGFRMCDVKGRDAWSSDRPNLIVDLLAAIRMHALPFLNRAATVIGAAEVAEAKQSKNSHILEGAAYCRVLAGDVSHALAILQNVPEFNRTIAWQNEQATRIEGMIHLLQTDPDAARKQLLTWEAETCSALKIRTKV